MGRGYGWWVGWMYGWALIITVASVDTGFVIYAGPLINQLFHTNIVPTDPTAILIFTVCLLAVQTFFNIVGVNLLGFISKIGVYVETSSMASSRQAMSPRRWCSRRGGCRGRSSPLWRSPG
jgi:amino acid transporter